MRKLSKRVMGIILSCSISVSVFLFEDVFSVNAYAATNVDTSMSTSSTLDFSSSVIKISTKEQLIEFAKESQSNHFKGKSVILEKSISLLGSEWSGIGNTSYQFSGTFDGRGHDIRNLSFDSKAKGLFNVVGTYGVVKNLGISGSSIKVIESYDVASMIGINKGKVINCYNKSNIYALHCVGGLIAYNRGTVENSYVLGNVNASNHIGGIVLNNTGTIRNCYTTSAVSISSGYDLISFENSANINNTYFNIDKGNSKWENVNRDILGMKTGYMRSQAFVDKLNQNAESIDDGWIWTMGSINNQGYPMLVNSVKVNITDDKNGSISVLNGDTVLKDGSKIITNTKVQITATANKDYKLHRLYVNNSVIRNGATVTLSRNATIKAEYRLK